MKSAVLMWLLRRILEIGGTIGVGATILAQIDPTALNQMLSVVGKILTGDFADINLGTLIASASVLGGLAWNAISTFRSKVVVKGRSVPIKELPITTKRIVETSVENVVAEHKRRPTILEKLFPKRE